MLQVAMHFKDSFTNWWNVSSEPNCAGHQDNLHFHQASLSLKFSSFYAAD
jgi:hypothetical protein